MEERMIIVSQVKSNRSDFQVWQVSINNEQSGMQHCKSPLKALRYAFILKKQTGVKIAQDSIEYLKAEISRQKELQGKNTEAEHIELEEIPASVRQFNKLKKEHPDALFLFREDDFYTAYSQDAEDVSEILGVVITKKGRRNTASFPHSALDTYLPKLVRAGKRIAICDSDKEAA